MNPSILALLGGIIAVLGVLHLLWGLGIARGSEASLSWTRTGPVLSKPGPAANLGVAFQMMIAAAGVWLPYDPWLKTQSLRLMALILALRALGDFRECGFFKRIRDSRFALWDTYVYSPVCLLLAALALVATVE